MKDWKELELYNLPPDILTGDYEFDRMETKLCFPETKYISSDANPIQILQALLNGDCEYNYRKAEPKQPTHTEIMTKWWELADNIWLKCIMYKNHGYYFYDTEDGTCVCVTKKSLTGKESADIPPEENN